MIEVLDVKNVRDVMGWKLPGIHFSAPLACNRGELQILFPFADAEVVAFEEPFSVLSFQFSDLVRSRSNSCRKRSTAAFLFRLVQKQAYRGGNAVGQNDAMQPGVTMQRYKDLKVWQRSHAFVLAVYKLTAQYPTDERFRLTNETRRSARSVPSNMVEGTRRKSNAPNSFHARRSLQPSPVYKFTWLALALA